MYARAFSFRRACTQTHTSNYAYVSFFLQDQPKGGQLNCTASWLLLSNRLLDGSSSPLLRCSDTYLQPALVTSPGAAAT